MKKKFKIKAIRCPSAKVFKNDLEEIIEILRGEKNNQITISDDDYEYTSLEEVEHKNGQNVKALEFENRVTSSPHVKVRIGNGISIVSFSGVEGLPVVVSIQEIILKCRRPLLSLLFNPFLYLIICFGTSFYIFRRSTGEDAKILNIVVWLILAALLFGSQSSGLFLKDNPRQ